MKKAIVYDKWLDSLGGGEVVACMIAHILKKNGYDVTLIGGKKFPTQRINKKLHIDLHGVHFDWVWNDELLLKSKVRNADVFINTTFMDYSYGYAKRNFYYTHFPTQAHMTIKGRIFNEFLLPNISRFAEHVEFISEKDDVIINTRHGYLLREDNQLLFSHEQPRERALSFSLFFENFYETLLESVDISLEGAKILKKDIRVDSHHNLLHFRYVIRPKSNSFVLRMTKKPLAKTFHSYPHDRIVLMFPKTLPQQLIDQIVKKFKFKIVSRMRAGLFVNILNRMDSYNRILANSEYTKKWIMNYWKRDADVVYPPVNFIKSHDKKNYICSIGRFFTLGHGKKQEIMIRAFKEMCNRGLKGWELHLIGSIDTNQSDSFLFARKLQKEAKGYPIFFHFNADHAEMEKIVGESSIYWHAAGFGESEKKYPVKFEHFGIAPIEAISAGCIPVLFAGGGLPEIIQKLSLSNDHLFTTIDELVLKSEKIIKGDHHFYYENSMKTLTAHFSTQAFEKHIMETIKKYE